MRDEIEITPERFSRLPVWAKRYINVLEGDNNHYRKRLGMLDAKPSKRTPIFHGTYITGNKRIPDDDYVSFLVDSPSCHSGRIDARLVTEGGLRFLDIRGERPIEIYPSASNHIKIRTQP